MENYKKTFSILEPNRFEEPVIPRLPSPLPALRPPSAHHLPTAPTWWCNVSKPSSNEQAVMDEASATVFVTIQKFYYPLLCILGIPGR